MKRRDFLTLNKAKQTPLPPPIDTPKRKTTARNTSLNPQQLSSRFLAQATLGPTMQEIESVTNIGFEAWIDQQLAIPQTETLTYMWTVIDKVFRLENESLLGLEPFRWAWWQAVMRGPDLLRQRVAMALSEIMVISTKTDTLEDVSVAVASWYDMLLKHAFGNFRDLLFDVALHPAMGYYLSHASNRKSNPATNRYPDENFAREVMQLFSIGLFELNLDGTRKKNANGADIPTYDNTDIKEFAKIFTGLTYQTASWWAEEGIDPNTEDDFVATEMSIENGAKPMKMYEQFHESGEKRLLNGYVVPAGQTGMQDINNAIDNLFQHPNVGPFISRLLIQRLVKSNPSPAYISRAATKFNDNGQGIRGDMQAVVKAILLDDEARNTTYLNDPTHGMLREPFIRYTQLCRALEVRNLNGENQFFNSSDYAAEALGQYPFASPSVFNFFSPDFKPLGALLDNQISAPEFQITTSVSTIKLANFMAYTILDDYYMEVPEGVAPEDAGTGEIRPTVSDVVRNDDPFQALRGNVTGLIDRLDLLFTYGTLSTAMRSIIETNVNNFYTQTDEWDETVSLALILIVTCPEYAILK